MSLRQRVLSAVAHPNIAYLLLSLGTLALDDRVVESGRHSARASLAACRLLLAFFAFSVLPVNYAGLLLILFGLLLLVLEIKVTSFGLLTVGGLVSLVFGSMILMDSSLPGIAVESRRGPSRRAWLRSDRGVPGATRRRRPAPPRRSRAGRDDRRDRARRLTAITPHMAGRSPRTARSGMRRRRKSIPEGARVRVTGVDGLTLVVRED